MSERVPDLILVIDLGTQSIRGTAVDREGRTWFSRSHAIATDREGSRCEQDPRVWRDCLYGFAREARAEFGDHIRATVATGTLSGLVCLDADGEVLRPAIMYGDQRSRQQAARIDASPAFHNWGGWRAHSCDFLPQLLYVAEQEPETYRRSRYILDATGYLNYLLTGKATLDAYTRFHCYASPADGELPQDLFHSVSLDTSRVGEVQPLGKQIGGWNGLVIAASYDSICAYHGAALQRFGDSVDISGTVTSFGVLHSAAVADPQRRVYSLPWINDTWLVRGSTAMSGGVLEWALRGIVSGGFDEFDALVGQSVPGANGVLFLPFLAGERAPVWNEKARGTFFGLTPETTRADLARAVYEGLCYSLRHIQTVIEGLNVPVCEVRLAGGLARNSTFNGIKADITGKTLRPINNPELTTTGCVAIAGCSLGWYGSMREAQEMLVRLDSPVEPNLSLSGVYADGFHRYIQLLTALEPLFR